MGFNSAQMAQAGLITSVAGAAQSAVGSYYGAKTQKNTMLMQAQAAQYDANSAALAMTGEAALQSINAQAVYNSSITGAEFSKLAAQQAADQMRNQAKINTMRAGNAAAVSEMGAQIDDRNAALNELQAQAVLLRGEYKEQDTRMQYAQAKSKATAALGKGNIDMGQGAGLSVRAGYDLMSENTAIQIQQSVLMDAFGQRVAAMNNQTSAAAKRMSAANSVQMASIESGMANADADFTLSTAQASYQAAKALAGAGLLNDEAAAQYKTTMAGVMRDNASVAAMIKRNTAGGVSPSSAAFGSLLSGAGQVAQAWYNYKKVAP